MSRLTEIYRITESSLNHRKQFIELTDEDIRVLKKLAPWADRVADKIAQEFYIHQFSFPPTVAFFEQQAQRKKMSLNELCQYLEKKQAEYFREIFQEAVTSGHFGTTYFERRLYIGKLHNVINLPLKWYVGSYAKYQDLVRKYLTKAYRWRFGFRSKAEKAIFTVFNYDLQAVTDSFFYDYLQSIGVELSSVMVELEEQDLSDNYDMLKKVIQGPLREAIRTSHRLIEASNQLSDIAHQADQATNQITATIQRTGQEIAQQTQSVTQVASSIEQMSHAINGVAIGAQEQAQAVTKTSEINAQIMSSIQQVAVNAQSGAEDSNEAAQTARSGAETVEKTIQGMGTIKTKVGLSAQKVRDMGKRSNQIGAIVETIDDIASQTNLLALNAAIEAARAGEHGKGFAVVADQVRKLAEKSGAAAKEIAVLVQDIRQTVTEAVTAMDQGAAEVEAGVFQANEAGQALTNILNAIEAVNKQMEEISLAAQQISESSKESLGAMESVSAVVEENSAATEQMAANSNEVTQAIESIAAISQENNKAMARMSTSAAQMSTQLEEVAASAQWLNDTAQTLQQVMSQLNIHELLNDKIEVKPKPTAKEPEVTGGRSNVPAEIASTQENGYH